MTMTDVEVLEHEGAMTLTPMAPTPEAARQAMQTYQAISAALIEPDEDMQTIRTKKGPKTFPKRSAFQKIGNAYRVSTEIISEHLDYDSEGRLVRARYRVRATHPDGRHVESTGACSRDEERFARETARIDHDLPTTAETRATNRAISNLVAFGAVSAEEAESDQERAVGSGGGETPKRPAWAEPATSNAVADAAHGLTRIFAAAGLEKPADAAIRVGQAIDAQCDGMVPVCITSMVERIVAQTRPVDPAGPSPTEPTRTDEPAPDQDPAEAPSGPPEPPDAPAPIEVHPHPERKQEDDA